jgi:hypothetical protein
MQSYLDFQPEAESPKEVDEVVLFSGGLDSLAGAVVESIRDKRRVALVSHRANPKINSKQKLLVNGLAKRCQETLFHVPVWIQKGETLDREYTQRTRSFLYAALAAIVARAFGLRGITWRASCLGTPKARSVLAIVPSGAPVDKFQLHRRFGIQCAGGANWSFPPPGEVG